MTQTLITKQRHLLASLREAREHANLTFHSVAERLDWPLSKLVAIETGSDRVSSTDLVTLLDLYDVAETRKSELIGLANTNKTEAWWDTTGEEGVRTFLEKTNASRFLSYLELENSTTCFREFSPLFIPGLLQTKDYARNIIGLYDKDFTEEQREMGLTARMKRQELLQRGLEAFFIIDETCLYREVGNRDVMRAQLLHLKNLNRQPNIGIQMLPQKTIFHPAMTETFSVHELFTPDNNELEFAVNLNGAARADHILVDPRKVNLYLQSFLELASLARPMDQLDSVIDPILDELAA